MQVADRQTAFTALLNAVLLLGTVKRADTKDKIELLCNSEVKSIQTDVVGKPGQSFDVRFDCSDDKTSFTRCYPPQIPTGVEAESMFDASLKVITNDPSLLPGQAYLFKCYSGFTPFFRFEDFAYKLCQKPQKNREAKIELSNFDSTRKVKVAFDCDGPTISKCYPNGRDKKGFGVTKSGTFSTWSVLGGTSEFTIACNKYGEPKINTK